MKEQIWTFLSEELDRKDRRQFFLWTILASAVGLTYYFGSFAYWHWNDVPKHLASLLALGWVAFVVLLAPVLSRFLRAAEPAKAYAALSAEEGAIVTKFLLSFGFPARARALMATTVVLHFLGPGILIVWSSQLYPPWMSSWLAVSGMTLVLVGAVGIFYVFMPSAWAAGAHAITYCQLHLGRIGNDRKAAKANRWYRELWLTIGSLPRLWALSAWRRLDSKREFRERPRKFLTLIQTALTLPLALLGFEVLFSARAPSVGSNAHAVVIAVSLAVAIGLGAFFLAMRLMFDPTRQLVDQLKTSMMLGTVNDQEVMHAYVVIETLQRTGFFSEHHITSIVRETSSAAHIPRLVGRLSTRFPEHADLFATLTPGAEPAVPSPVGTLDSAGQPRDRPANPEP